MGAYTSKGTFTTLSAASTVDSIQLPYPSIAKSDEEIAEEISYIEGLFGFTTTVAFSLKWEPYPLLPMISSLGIDQDNQLWIQTEV